MNFRVIGGVTFVALAVLSAIETQVKVPAVSTRPDYASGISPIAQEFGDWWDDRWLPWISCASALGAWLCLRGCLDKKAPQRLKRS